MTADHGGARDAQELAPERERRAAGPGSGRSTSGLTSGATRGRSSGPSAAAFAGVGLQLGFTLALFAWLGTWLDRRLGTGPWLLILLVFVGAAAGFYSIYRRVIGPGGGAGSRPPRGP